MERHLVRQGGVAKQHFQTLAGYGLVDVVRRFPRQQVLGAFGHHGFVAHLQDTSCQLVVVEQLGVPEGGGFLPEQFLQDGGFALELVLKLGVAVFRSQRIGVRSSHKLNGFGGSQLFHRVHHFGGKLLQQLQQDAAHGDTAAELTT